MSKFAPETEGALAQLARVSDWQSEGHGFDSRTLHNFFLFFKLLNSN
jgi:hypothetical protein